ncbi:GNAT family N-acetyltransferase [Photobacterium minamisatsumaniensis]|uniref:GNAT family N-acetyltransferase n=1 Tax=Photobacterium minamisatsumaniensis TaxID=2910233 RepID=UPI003D0CD5D3
MRDSHQYKCILYDNLSYEHLENIWLDLEKKSVANFFISWNWIGNWLKQHVHKHKSLIVYYGDEVVGCGIIIESKSFFRNTYYLNHTGDDNLDQVWIEHNNFVIDNRHNENVKLIIANKLHSMINVFDKIVVGVSELRSIDYLTSKKIHSRNVWAANSYKINFLKIKEKNINVDDTLSSNFKRQIKRSIKKYNAYGELRLSEANGNAQAQEWFDDMAKYHQKKWSEDSGFNNKDFIRFHKSMINSDQNCEHIKILKLEAGTHLAGYVYLYIYNNEAYFYLSALNYDLPHRHCKPGLTIHYLIICKLWIDGLNGYDFLGGESRYKKSFSNEAVELVKVDLQRSSLWTVMLNSLRNIKNKISV